MKIFLQKHGMDWLKTYNAIRLEKKEMKVNITLITRTTWPRSMMMMMIMISVHYDPMIIMNTGHCLAPVATTH